VASTRFPFGVRKSFLFFPFFSMCLWGSLFPEVVFTALAPPVVPRSTRSSFCLYGNFFAEHLDGNFFMAGVFRLPFGTELAFLAGRQDTFSFGARSFTNFFFSSE